MNMKKLHKNVWSGIAFGIIMTITNFIMNYFFDENIQNKSFWKLLGAALVSGIVAGFIYGFVIGKLERRKGTDKEAG